MKTARSTIVFTILTVLGFQAWSLGADPATKAAGQPAAPPRKVIIPPGFHLITVANRNIICQATDDAWIKDAVTGVKPATRPTTMPSDVITDVKSRRDIVI